jgi:hypothetical protein
MARFIIGYGWHADVDVVDFFTKEEALAEATQRSLAEGLLAGDLQDTTWVKEYDEDLALDLGLREEATKREIWRSQAPWR